MKISYSPDTAGEGLERLGYVRSGSVILHNDTLYLVGSRSTPAGRTENGGRYLISLNAGTVRVEQIGIFVRVVEDIRVTVDEPLPPKAVTQLQRNSGGFRP